MILMMIVEHDNDNRIPIDVTLVGMVTVVSEVHPLQKPSSNANNYSKGY